MNKSMRNFSKFGKANNKKGGFAGDISTLVRLQINKWLNQDRGGYKNGAYLILFLWF